MERNLKRLMKRKTMQPEIRLRMLGNRIRIALLVAIAATGWACAPSVVAQDQVRMGPDPSLNTAMPIEAQGITVEQKLGDSIPINLPLTTSEGRQIKTGYVFDTKIPTIVTLNYSDCPMLCSIQLNQLTQSLDKMDLKIGTDFNILTVSIDPKESTSRAAETKARYLKDLPNQPGAEKGWTFATAKQPIITKLADTLGFRYRYDAYSKQYNHPAMLAFVSPTGVITRYSLSLDFPPEQMKLALVEAGEGTVGSAVDQFILWCYSYDPDSNSYTPHAWRIMRLCGAGFIGIVLAALIPYWAGRKGNPNGVELDGDAPNGQSPESDATGNDASGSEPQTV